MSMLRKVAALSADEVKRMAAAYRDGVPMEAIARRFKVSLQTLKQAIASELKPRECIRGWGV